MSTLPVPDAAYWSRHRTIVITWPGDLAGVPSLGRHRREPNGDLSVEYTRDDLALAVTVMRELRGESQSAPTATRVVFPRLSQRDGQRLMRQADAQPRLDLE